VSKRWQYLTVEVKPKTFGGHDASVVQDHLNRQGQLGWELVNSVNNGAMYPLILLFKREN